MTTMRETKSRDLSGPALFAGLLAAAALFRFWSLGGEGLWVDEGYTSTLTQGSLGEILRALSMDDAPPLYYLLQKPILGLLGRSEFALRFLSALSGTALVAALYWAGSAIGKRTAWMGAILAASSVVAVFYSRQARSYALVQLLAALLMGCALRIRLRPSMRMAALFWALSMGLIYLHNLGALIIAAAWLVIAYPFARPRVGPRVGLALALATLLGAIPWILSLQTQSAIHAEYNEWMRAWWDQGRSILLAPLLSWGVFINGAAAWLAPPIHLAGLQGPWRALLLPLLAPVAWGVFSATASLWRRSGAQGQPSAHPARARERKRIDVGQDGSHSKRCNRVSTTSQDPDLERNGVIGSLSFALVPTLGLLAISLFLGPAYVLGRTDSPALPGFLLLVAIGLSRIRPVWAGRAAGALWVAVGLVSLIAFAPQPKGSDRDLASAIGRHLGPNDALVFSGLTRPTLEHYAHRDGWWDRLGWGGSFPGILDKNPAGIAPISTDSIPRLMQEALDLRGTWERDEIETVWILAMRSMEGGDPAVLRLRDRWPDLPREPGADESRLSASQIAFPANLVVASLIGPKSARVRYEYRQDWVSGLRVLLEVPMWSRVPLDSIPEIEVRR